MIDEKLLPLFDSVKDNDENMLWTGKPVFIPYLTSGISVDLFILVFTIGFMYITFTGEAESGNPSNMFYIIALLPLIQRVYVFLIKLLSFSNTAYAYSNKRIMIRTGFIGTDFKTIDYDKISDIEVKVSVIEKMFDVGTVRFYSGRTENTDNGIKKLTDRWIAITNPYEIFKMVKQISVDIKTDYNYPNALRPESNPGYNTKYKRKPNSLS